MKKTTFNPGKKIMASASMLLVSAMMLSSATYAWFTMNKTVSVTGMKLQATAEDGLVIDDFTRSGWATSKNVNMSSAAVLAPASAAAVTSPTFVRNASDTFDNAKADQESGYEDLTLSWSTEAADSGSIGSVTIGEGQSAISKNYVLKRTFYIKASGDTNWATNLVIDEVTATAEGSASANLDKSLRVLVVASDGTGSNAFIYAPIAGATASYNWKGTASGAVAVSAVASTTDSTCTNITSIPAASDANATPITVTMYLYFEGEDANCKSSNISGISVDTLTVSAKFKTAQGPADS